MRLPKTVYCDMDGVLVDLLGGVSKLYGIPMPQDPSRHNGFVEDMKQTIDADHPDLFAKLPWTEDGKRLWLYLCAIKVERMILSARTTTWQPNSVRDKMAWIERELTPPPNWVHLVLRSEKKKYAVGQDGTPNILIDDWDRNIAEWRKRGGIGILHTSADGTIRELERMGYRE